MIVTDAASRKKASRWLILMSDTAMTAGAMPPVR